MKKIASVFAPAAPFVAAKTLQNQSFFYVHQESDANELLHKFQTLLPLHEVVVFPAFDCLPYDRASPSQDILAKRVRTLLKLASHQTSKPFCVITPVEAILQKVPPKELLAGHTITISLGDTLSRELLLEFLHDQGFSRTETVYEVGDYAVRGSIIDIYPVTSTQPVRIDFFGDEVESIRTFDVSTQKTLEEVLSISLEPVSELFLNEQTISRFRQNFRLHGSSESPLYKAISEGRSYPGMEHFLPLFYEAVVPVFFYLPDAAVFLENNADRTIEEQFERIETYYYERQDVGVGERPYYPLAPEKFYLSDDALNQFLCDALLCSSLDHGDIILDVESKPLFGWANLEIGEEFAKHLQAKAKDEILLFCAENKGRLDRLSHTLKELGLTAEITQQIPTKPGIYGIIYPELIGFTSSTLSFIPVHVLIGEKQKQKAQKAKNIDRFFKELNTYAIGDFLVHRDHGVGKYMGLETIEVDRRKHDCITLEYAEGSKLFLPVESMEVLTHYAREGAAAEVDRLGSAAWQNKKARVKKKLFEIAEHLLKIAAARKLKSAPHMMHIIEDYQRFCEGFPYIETEDQLRAIEEVQEDLFGDKPMDRLVCGDVGFGKTEVALRAAFLAVSSGYQVIVVVPTTLLARQHFENFQNRFKGFPYRAEMLCRLVKAKKADEIREDFEAGKVNILIATHAAFSDKIKSASLGLLIVDEEQHFGVKQKEKLKKLKEDIHILTLSATPIPRTLQMSLSGIRELSLITTPPVDRLPVKTFVFEQDFTLLRDVILREYKRGGQIFFVSPRLEDLPNLKEKLTQVVPEIKLGVAHGQMKPAELEDTIQDFYDHKFDLLLSTNIIESGIDVPNANTLIVHKSHLFGLAQLYQIRGRIGRSKKQGYAYLTVPTEGMLGEAALKRLKVLQSLDHLGAGFTLASHDLDIRGAGNLVGEEQSGHIKEVGVELYQHMLQEAILSLRATEAKAEAAVGDFTPVINLGLSVMIPETYIADLSLRLGLYKRISSLKTEYDIDQFRSEMIDRFGPIPEELENLLHIVLIKEYCYQAGIEKVDAGDKGVLITFYKNAFAKPEALIELMQKQAGRLKIRPDQKLVLSGEFQSLEKRTNVVEKLTKALAKMVSS